MKKQRSIVALMLSIAGLVGVVNESLAAESVPAITSSSVFPLRSRTPSIANVVRHSFKLQVPSQGSALSQLSITVPEGLRLPQSVTVVDGSKQVVPTDVAMTDRQITLTFLRSVSPGTLLKISLNNVRVAGRTNAWIYPVRAKVVGLSHELPIGVARFRTGY